MTLSGVEQLSLPMSTARPRLPQCELSCSRPALPMKWLSRCRRTTRRIRASSKPIPRRSFPWIPPARGFIILESDSAKPLLGKALPIDAATFNTRKATLRTLRPPSWPWMQTGMGISSSRRIRRHLSGTALSFLDQQRQRSFRLRHESGGVGRPFRITSMGSSKHPGPGGFLATLDRPSRTPDRPPRREFGIGPEWRNVTEGIPPFRSTTPRSPTVDFVT